MNITATKSPIICAKVNISGLNNPFLATSIIPLENRAPPRTPRLANIRIIWRGATFDPIAELRKFTASLATPKTRSERARAKRTRTIII